MNPLLKTSKAVMSHVDEDNKQFVMLDIAYSQKGNVPCGQSKTAVDDLLNDPDMMIAVLTELKEERNKNKTSGTPAKHIDIEDKLNSKTLMSLEPDKRNGVTICDSLGRVHEQTAVNEIVLFLLILSSKLPTDKKFNHSGCRSVLEELL